MANRQTSTFGVRLECSVRLSRRGSSVGAVKGHGRNHSLIPGKINIFLRFLKARDPVWGPPSLLPPPLIFTYFFFRFLRLSVCLSKLTDTPATTSTSSGEHWWILAWKSRQTVKKWGNRCLTFPMRWKIWWRVLVRYSPTSDNFPMPRGERTLLQMLQ